MIVSQGFLFSTKQAFDGESSRQIDSMYVRDHVCTSPGHCTPPYGSRFFGFRCFFFFLFFLYWGPLPLFSPPFVLFNPRPSVPLFLAPAVLVPPPLRRRRGHIAIFYRFYSREHLAFGQREPGPQEISEERRVVRPFSLGWPALFTYT